MPLSSVKKQQVKEKLGEAVELIRETGLLYPSAKLLGIKQSTLVKYLTDAGVDYHKLLKPRGYTLPHNRTNAHTCDCVDSEKNVPSARLRIKLISSGLKSNRCEICGRSKWMKKQIPLELHHINGDHHDNRIENLMVVCSNCHSQSHGYSNFGTPKIKKETGRDYRKKSQVNGSVAPKLCCDCGKAISFKSTRCRRCEQKHRIRNNVKYDPLTIVKSVKTTGSFLGAAKIFNVSANALVKFLRTRGYPYHTKDVKDFPLQPVT